MERLSAKRNGFAILLLLVIGLPIMKVEANDFAWRVALDLNYIDPEDNLSSRYESEYGIGFNIEYEFHEYLGMVASGRYVEFNRKLPRGESDLGILYFLLDGIIKYEFNEDWEVFGAGGLGTYAWDSDHAWWDEGGNSESVDIGINYGFGVFYNVYKNIDVGLKYFRHEVELEPDDDISSFADISISARFSF